VKNLFILLLIIIGVAAASCRKDDPVIPARDKFLGMYVGDYTQRFSMGNVDYFPLSGRTSRLVEPSDKADEIVINKGTADEFSAKVDGLTCEIYEQSFLMDFGESTPIPATLSGSGSLSGSNMLAINLKIAGVYRGAPFVLIVSESLLRN
jgi:hypothetical protein